MTDKYVRTNLTHNETLEPEIIYFIFILFFFTKPNANQAKRSLSVSSIDSNKDNEATKKPTRGVYHPPTGKYSTNSPAQANASNANNNGQHKGKRRTFSHGERGRGRGRF